MRPLFSTLAAAALAAAFVSPDATACDKGQAGHAKMDCCAKKGAATTASVRPARADEEVVSTFSIESAGRHDCPMMKAAAAAAAAAKIDCPMHRAKAEATTASTAPAAAAPAEGQALRASGKVLCARCDLHQTASCRSVFQREGTEAAIPLSGEGLSAELLKLTKHGELPVTVQGRLKANDAGESVLYIDGFSVGSI